MLYIFLRIRFDIFVPCLYSNHCQYNYPSFIQMALLIGLGRVLFLVGYRISR